MSGIFVYSDNRCVTIDQSERGVAENSGHKRKCAYVAPSGSQSSLLASYGELLAEKLKKIVFLPTIWWEQTLQELFFPLLRTFVSWRIASLSVYTFIHHGTNMETPTATSAHACAALSLFDVHKWRAIYGTFPVAMMMMSRRGLLHNEVESFYILQ